MFAGAPGTEVGPQGRLLASRGSCEAQPWQQAVYAGSWVCLGSASPAPAHAPWEASGHPFSS